MHITKLDMTKARNQYDNRYSVTNQETLEPVLCDLCHERPLVLNDHLPRHGSVFIKMYPQ